MPREDELVRRAQSGDLDAFEALMRAHEKSVYNLALRMTNQPQDAEDMAQEAFLKLWRALPDFRWECKFSVWLYRIVSNVCLDWLRRQSRRPAVSLSAEDEDGETVEREIPDERQTPERLLEQKLTREAVQAGLGQLSEEQRQILLLREIRELSYEEIGQALSLEPGTVKSRLFRARRKLADWLLANGNIPDGYTSKRAKGD